MAGPVSNLMFVLRLEAIGDNWRWYARQLANRRIQNPRWHDKINAIRYGQRRHRPWAARVLGPDEKYGFQREFIRGPRDYTYTDKVGERGIYEYFYLDPGLYEINEPQALGQSRRYFARVTDNSLVEISREELVECLNDISA